MKRRVLSIITALALCLSMFPPAALAAESDGTGLCPHHTEHTAECGYIAPTEGQPCTHQHTEDCYTEVVSCVHVHDESCYGGSSLPAESGAREPDACTHVCTAESGCITRSLDCTHAHDGACGYVPADPGQPCGYECPICPVQELIDALPDAGDITAENAPDVKAQLTAIDEARAALTDEELDELDTTKYGAAVSALLALEGMAGADKIQALADVSVTENDTTWEDGTYTVTGNITLTNRVTVKGTVTLQLNEGCKLTASQGINVPPDSSLTIQGTGELVATGGNVQAGIGGGSKESSGIITINGGTVTATGGMSGAGIGGGWQGDGTVIINGGTVTATSGPGNSTNNGGAGIGGGNQGSGTVTITGGIVTAKAAEGNQDNKGSSGAGIGGGSNGAGTVTISGTAQVEATGSDVGGGGAGIGGGEGGKGIVTISGTAQVVAVGSQGAGIGDGRFGSGSTFSTVKDGVAGKAWIEASSISDTDDTSIWSGIIFQGNNGGVYGNQTLNSGTEIPSGKSLTVTKGATLTISSGATLTSNNSLTIAPGGSITGGGTITGEGTFTAKNLTTALISVPTNLVYSGNDQSENIKNGLKLPTDPVSICGKDFQFDATGWVPSVAKSDDSELEYTVTYIHDGDSSTAVTKTVTLGQSGTEFVDTGAVKAYKGETPATEFTYGETITVKATPTPTGAAPAMLTASLTAPISGQMALYLGNTQVSDAASLGADSQYTMTVSVKDLIDAGAQYNQETALTAKFVGNDYMADGTGAVKVTLKPAPLTIQDAALAAKTYDGTKTADVSSVTFSGLADGEALALGTDYTVAAEFTDANAETGKTATVTVTLKDTVKNYTLSPNTFTLTGQTIQQKTITPTVKLPEGSFMWDNGNEIKPVVTVTYTEGDQTFTVPNTEYAVTYNNNIAPGPATVNVTGDKNYSFTATADFTITCPHTNVENGVCQICGQTIVATVESGGTTYYTDITSAWNYANGKTATITMLQSQTVNEMLEMTSGNVTLTMASGVKLTGTTSEYGLIYVTGGTLTLDGCTIESQNKYASVVAGGSSAGSGSVVNIKNCDISGQNCAAVYNDCGTVNIYSGMFKGSGKNTYGLSAWQDATTHLYGGTFSGESKAIQIVVASGTLTVGDLLADGYAYKTASGWITGDNLKETSLTGPVEVKPVPVTITKQPTASNATPVYGDAVTLSIEAEAADTSQAITYKWYDGENTPVTSEGNTSSLPAGMTVGDYSYYCDVTCDGYTVTGGPVAVHVAKRPVTVTAKGQTITYGENIQQGVAHAEASNLVSGDVLADVTLTQNVSTKKITPSAAKITRNSVGWNDNYDITYADGALTVNKADITLTFTDNQTITYGGTPTEAVATPAADISYSWVSTTDASKTGSGWPTDVGKYTVTASVAESENYNRATATATLTISPKTVTATVSVDGTYTYTGEAIVPPASAVTVTYQENSETFTIPSNQYAFTCANNVNAGTASVKIENRPEGNYVITAPDGEFTIDPASLPGAQVTVSGSYTYTGQAQTPDASAVTVTLDGKTLTSDDYTFAATDNVNVGTASVTVTGKRNYTGTATGNFTIGKATPVIAWSNPTQMLTYTGTAAAITAPTVTLVNGENFSGTISYSYEKGGETVTGLPVDAGTYTIKASIAASGNYTAATSADPLTLTIKQAKVTITWNDAAQSVEYTGAPAAITAPAVSAENNITVSVDPAYSYVKQGESTSIAGLPTNAGTYTVTASIEESGNLTAASADMTLTISPKTLDNNAITLANTSYEYTGSAITPAVTVKDEALNYTLGADEYTVEYSNNTSVGTNATVTIKDKDGGNYTINVTKNFEITKSSLTTAEVTLAQTTFTYDGTAQTPEVTVTKGGKVLTKGTDYTVTYTNNTNAGANTASVTVTGINNYEGEKTVNFTISPKPVTAVVTAASRHFDGTRNATVTAEINSGDLANGDSITITGLTGTFDSMDVGTGKTVTVDSSNAVISGNAQGNYTIKIPPTTTADIERATVKITWSAASQSVEYTGAPAAIADPSVTAENGVTVSVDPEYSYAKQGETAFSKGLPTNAGTYTVRASIKESGNLTAASADMTLTITAKAVTSPIITLSPTSYEYDGTAKEPAVTVMDGSTKIDPGEYTVEYSNNSSVGTATVKITDSNAAGNYVITETSVSFTITTASISGATVLVSGTYTYTESAQTPDPTVTLGDKTLVKGTDYTVSYSDNVNAGTATVTVTGKGNYKDTATGNFIIGKADLTASGTGTASGSYGAKLSELKVEGLTASLNGTPVSGSWALSGDTIPNVGDNSGYTATFTPDSGADNCNTLTAEVKLSIAKVNYTGTTAVNTSGKYGAVRTYDLVDLLPDGFVLGTATTSDNTVFVGTPSVTGTTLNYELVNDAGNVGKTGTITIPVDSSTNYNAFNLTITVTVTNVVIPDLSVNTISVTYTGSPVPDSSITGTAAVDGKSITGKWSFASGQAITNVADSGVKQVIFTPDDDENYGIGHGAVSVTISKATPHLTLAPSSASLPNGGAVTLTLSGLPSGGSASVTCSDQSISLTAGAGNTWTATIPSGGASYTFTASYTGDGNHNGATATCTVSLEKATLDLSLKASPDTLKGGGVVMLTLSGLPAGETASVTCSGGINIEKGAGNTWTATLPNSNGTYTFTASYAGSAAYKPASASCVVKATGVVILPDPPADDSDTKFQLTMETGISEVPAGLKNIETLDTPEKLETAMKTAITQANTGIPQERTSVYDVELLISTDGGKTWTHATKDNFPNGGLTVTLPYPDGTDSSYRFTVVHMFTTSDFGKKPGDTETFTPNQVKNTANGIQFVVTGLSPISVGWEKASSPSYPSGGGSSSGGSSSGYDDGGYAVTVKKSEHGKVISNHVNADSGETVALTVTPDSGYVLDTLTVTDSRGNELKLTTKGDGKYNFTMPSRAVTVKATFVPLPPDTEQPCDGGADCPSHSFTDLGGVGTWYHEAVDYVLRNGLMNGYGGGLFGPNENLSRAQLAQILYNHAGRPAVTGASPFTDVANGEWYANAITWAAAQGIVGGYGNGLFGPNDNITREQLAVMLWRYAGSPAATDKELHFNDADEAGDFALNALRWAVENGILNGYGDGRLNPAGLATRAQVAAMLMRYMKDTQK